MVADKCLTPGKVTKQMDAERLASENTSVPSYLKALVKANATKRTKKDSASNAEGTEDGTAELDNEA